MTQETNKHPTDTELREKVEKAAMMLEERGHTQMSHELLAATTHQDAEIARLREELNRTEQERDTWWNAAHKFKRERNEAQAAEAHRGAMLDVIQKAVTATGLIYRNESTEALYAQVPIDHFNNILQALQATPPVPVDGGLRGAVMRLIERAEIEMDGDTPYIQNVHELAIDIIALMPLQPTPPVPSDERVRADVDFHEQHQLAEMLESITIEHVARAVCEADGSDPEDGQRGTCNWEVYTRHAKAAIAAIKALGHADDVAKPDSISNAEHAKGSAS